MASAQISPQASADAVKLMQGVDRAQVALDALKDSTLTAEQVKQLEGLLQSASRTEGTPSATQPQPGGRFETVDGHQAVVGNISVDGRQLDTLLSEGTFGTSRNDNMHYALKLGYYLATREQHVVYLRSLLEKEANGSINAAEMRALKDGYRERWVRDTQGTLEVQHISIRALEETFRPIPNFFVGALFVRASDAVKLMQGVDRAQVALDALKDSTLTAEQVKQLEGLLQSVSRTEGVPPATPSQAGSHFETIDGYQAVVDKISVGGQKFDTLLSEGTFGTSSPQQDAYAQKLGYQVASREQHLVYLKNLLEKEANASINASEMKALESHRHRWVRDNLGTLTVTDNRIRDHVGGYSDRGNPFVGTLLVRASDR